MKYFCVRHNPTNDSSNCVYYMFCSCFIFLLLFVCFLLFLLSSHFYYFLCFASFVCVYIIIIIITYFSSPYIVALQWLSYLNLCTPWYYIIKWCWFSKKNFIFAMHFNTTKRCLWSQVGTHCKVKCQDAKSNKHLTKDPCQVFV